MSKKDYVALAAILARNRPRVDPASFDELVEDIVLWLKADNAAFDARRFWRATGGVIE